MIQQFVLTDDYKQESAPIQLCANVGPCIAVGAIYGKKGYLAHYPSGSRLDLLEQMLKDLKLDVKNNKSNYKPKLKIYVAGGELKASDDQDTWNMVEDSKKCTLEAIANAGFVGNIQKVQWARACTIQTLILNLKKGKGFYEEEDYDPLPEEYPLHNEFY